MKHIITSSLCLLLIFSFFISSVPRANAALSEEAKTQLKEFVSQNGSTGGIMDIINYLYVIMYSDSMVGFVQPSTATDTNSTSQTEPTKSIESSSKCDLVKQLTKNLEKKVDDPQVKILQRLLNRLAYEKGVPYKYVAESGAGSFGNETTYYGEGTAAALEKWQANNKVLFFGSKAGIFESRTREKMKSEYCSNDSNVVTSPDSSQETFTSDSDSSTTEVVIKNESTSDNKKPKVTIDKSVIKKGEEVTLTFTENGFKNCRLFTKVGKKDSKVTLSEIENPYTVAPEKTTEYRLGCVNGFRSVYSDWVGVIVK